MVKASGQNRRSRESLNFREDSQPGRDKSSPSLPILVKGAHLAIASILRIAPCSTHGSPYPIPAQRSPESPGGQETGDASNLGGPSLSPLATGSGRSSGNDATGTDHRHLRWLRVVGPCPLPNAKDPSGGTLSCALDLIFSRTKCAHLCPRRCGKSWRLVLLFRNKPLACLLDRKNLLQAPVFQRPDEREPTTRRISRLSMPAERDRPRQSQLPVSTRSGRFRTGKHSGVSGIFPPGALPPFQPCSFPRRSLFRASPSHALSLSSRRGTAVVDPTRTMEQSSAAHGPSRSRLRRGTCRCRGIFTGTLPFLF